MRELTNKSDRFEFNCWDIANRTDEQYLIAKKKVENDNKNIIPQNIVYNSDAWNKFYNLHGTKFYKSRQWIKNEFPWISGKIIELGCGVGDSLAIFDKKDCITGVDFSESAIKLCKMKYDRVDYPNYDFRLVDITKLTDMIINHQKHKNIDDRPNIGLDNSECSPFFYENMYDTAILIWTLSSIHPNFYSKIFKSIFKILSPGGKLIFRDFGRMDHRQINYKSKQIISNNFYQRGDGTFTYFFDKEELEDMAEEAGFKCKINVNKKLTVNRKSKSELYRVLVTAVFEKPQI